METLKQKTARGLFWGGMNTMVQQVIGLLFGIILGRLLAPSDYGMMAIISVFSLVALAAALYYGVMRVAGAHILEECMQFLKGKR